MILLLIFIFLSTHFSYALKPGIGKKQQKFAYVDGDFIVGALFPVHERPSFEINSDPLACGKIREEYGIQRVEAALFAIDTINNNTNLLPGMKLGINIKDDCWSESVALNQAMKLVEEPAILEKDPLVNSTCSKNWEEEDDSLLIGIVGPASSSATIQVQNLLKLFKVPQIGYSATSTDLQDSTLYPYFLSVVPDDLFQVILLLRIMQRFNWSYMSLMYTDNSYGQSGMKILQEFAPKFEICIGEVIPIMSSSDEYDYDEAFGQLSKDTKAKVVICFCEEIDSRELLKTIKRLNATGKYQFLGSDGWSSKRRVIKDYHEQALGSITVGFDTIMIKEFEDYYLQRNPENNERNPWFKEFWEQKFNCEVKPVRNASLAKCTGNEKLEKRSLDDFKVSNIVRAIFAFAYALHNMQSDVCVNETGPCDNLYPFNTTKFLTYLEDVEFPFYGETVKLSGSLQNNTIKYNIYNFQMLEDGSFDYVEVGKIKETTRTYIFNSVDIISDTTEIQFQNGSAEPIDSFCARPCGPGKIKLLSAANKEKICCWNCVSCKNSEMKFNSTTCKECQKGFWPNSNKSECYKLPEIYSQWTDLESIISLFFAVVGIVLTVITAGIFIKYRDTPVVKSSTRELSFMMLLGMIMAHSMVFILVSKPTAIKCAIVRTLLPISFTIMYGSLLVKTSRIARLLAISKKKFPNMRPRFMSLQSQIIITLILVATEVAICIYMLYIYSPRPYVVPDPPDGIKILCPLKPGYVVIPFLFVGILVILCTVFAVKTRNLPQNFNEAKFIGFAMYVTCITWIAFILVYYGSEFQVLTTCICASTNSLVLLVFLFFPKLYIIICMPQRNTRAHFSTTNRIRCIIGREDSSQDFQNKKKLYRADSDYACNASVTTETNKTVTFSCAD